MILIRTKSYKQAQSGKPSDLNTQPGKYDSPPGPVHQIFPADGDSDSEQAIIERWKGKKKKKKSVPVNTLSL
jgi:hypothetical protein